MNLTEFVDQYRVKTNREPKLDDCAGEIIPGKQFCTDMPDRPEYRSHIYDGFDNGRLGLCLMYMGARKWNAAQRHMVTAGFLPRQVGDTEGCYTFDPANVSQVKLAMKLAGIKHAQMRSPAQIKAATDALAKARAKTAQPPQGDGVSGLHSDAA
jgi:hypothetical protein